MDRYVYGTNLKRAQSSETIRLSVVKPSCNPKPEGYAAFSHFGLFRVDAA